MCIAKADKPKLPLYFDLTNVFLEHFYMDLLYSFNVGHSIALKDLSGIRPTFQK